MQNFLRNTFFHWPLFFCVVIVAVAGAYLYIQSAKPVYPLKATLEFKNQKTDNGGTTQTGLKELDELNEPIVVENEIEVMKSKKLMYQVVNTLRLWVNYSIKDGLQTKDLYKATPVDFEWVKQTGGLNPQGQALKIQIINDKQFALIREDDSKTIFNFSQPIKNQFGTWQLKATSNVGNYRGETIMISVRDPDLVSDGYVTALKVALENKDAPFVNLNISDEIPARGRDILNSVMALYNAAAIDTKNRKAANTVSFIDKQLDSIGKELNQDEKKLETYSIQEGLSTNLDAQTNNNLDNSNKTRKDINDIDIQIGVVNEIENYINSSKNSGQPNTGNLQDPTLNTMLDKLSDLQLKKDQYAATTPLQNPIFVPLNKQISTLQESIKDRIRTIKTSLIATRKQLISYSSGFESSIRKSPTQTKVLSGMKRTSDIKEKLFSYLLEKREEISLRYASSVSDAQVVDDAHAGPMSWPKPMVIYVMAFLVGLGIPAGLIYARDSFDVLITNRKQIEDEIAVPILGELSFQESTTPIVVSQGRGKFAIGEQFRVLRTNLYHVHNNNASGRVTLFTSSTGGEGKSFVSANLAVTLAYASRKTIILEMDLRKPKVSLTFGLNPEHPGISNFLDGEKVDLKDLIQPSGVPGLDVLGCGSILPNPSELLEKSLLDDMISKFEGNLRRCCDRYTSDTPCNRCVDHFKSCGCCHVYHEARLYSES